MTEKAFKQIMEGLNEALEIARSDSAGRGSGELIVSNSGPILADMSALSIDTLSVSQTLRKRGFTEEQAIGVVEALREIDASELATKADIREVEAKIEKLELRIETSAANLKVEIIRWLIVTQLALGGLIFAAIKFAK